jgi:cytochrome P450
VIQREDTAKPAWAGDQLDSDSPPEIEEPYFDRDLDAWVLSRHADILAAFRSPSLRVAGPKRKKGSESHDESSRLKMREETLEALNPAQLRAWRELLTPRVQALADTLPTDRPVDVIDEYARPLCLILAAMVTGIGPSHATRLEKKAQIVSAAAAEPYDADLHACSKSVNAELGAHFPSGPEPLRSSGFVALSQTLPRILGNAWFALLRQPREWSRLHLQPELMEPAVEELLRFAGLVRVLFRMATQDVDINGSPIRKGERVILRIIAANRDPQRYREANQLEITRRGSGHLALGAGIHSCTGASLIRMGAVAITHPLLKRFAEARLAQPVEWHGGSGFRSPLSLWVRLSEA